MQRIQNRSKIAERLPSEQPVPTQPGSGKAQRTVLKLKYAILISYGNLCPANGGIFKRTGSNTETFQITLPAGTDRIGRRELNRFFQPFQPLANLKITHGIAQKIP